MNFILPPFAFIPSILLPLQLATGCLDIVSPRLAHIDLQPFGRQGVLELKDLLPGWPLVDASRMRIEGNQIDLAANALEELGEAPGIRRRMIKPPQQNILKRDPSSLSHRKGTATVDKLRQRVFAIDGHQLRAQLVR